MKITFNINYRTHWGESVYIIGNIAPEGALMCLDGSEHWAISLEVPAEAFPVEYRYEVRPERGAWKQEWGAPRRIAGPRSSCPMDVYDRWQDRPWDKPYYSQAFTGCICRRPAPLKPVQLRKGNVELQVAAPIISPDCILAVSGSAQSMGEWNPAKAIRMNDADFPIWKVQLPSEELGEATEYKFLILDRSGEVVAWEAGANRTLGVRPAEDAVTVLAGMRFIDPRPKWRGAGTAIPVFSLRSEDDFGVGDFYDLKKMVDWCRMTGQKFLQILPVNDTFVTGTWLDSYPYRANSCFALHPMYLRLEEMGVLADPARREYYDALRAELNALPEVDYERVNKAKYEYFRAIFAQEGKRTMALREYMDFVGRNSSWLLPYAAYCVLRDTHGTADVSKWGAYARYDKAKVAKYISSHKAETDFYCYLQYHLDRQMRHVHDYARTAGVALKGDVPIGIGRESVDAWTDTRLFNMDSQAGAPPDDFSEIGQNWGFPTYNWEEMARDGFAWWKARFRKMAEYFDSYRIDHILGFFRIWQIPRDALHGLLGVFNPALPFTADELRRDYDFWLDAELHTSPYITEEMLHIFFGPYAGDARQYLTAGDNGRYRLRRGFTTQRAIAEHFGQLPADERNTRLCDGLIGLLDQVLFIEDPYEKGKYHPRISAQHGYAYRALGDYEKWCFDRLYNDFFYRRHNEFWYGKAMWKLPPLIESTDMLTCAEDLGMIPSCVPAVLNNLEVLTLEIQRMPKDPGCSFGDPSGYPYYSVCTTSTHDMGGIRAWWEENRKVTADFYHNALHHPGEVPYFAEPWICREIVDMQLKSPSMLCILPLADWLSMSAELRREKPLEEIINVPANPRNYWRYRMHLTLERLKAAELYNKDVSNLIARSSR